MGVWNEQIVHIRKAVLTDMDELLAIEQACFGNERFDQLVLRNVIVTEGFESFIAHDDAQLVGSAMIYHDKNHGESRIVSIAVMPGRRGKGDGRRFLECLEERALYAGSHRIGLEVRMTNVPAINLYLTSGYEVLGRIHNYFGMGQDALYMEKPLGPM
ncbi:MAG: putative N-acetyltransferase [Methanomassiliicoccales archaeon PtaU1.Bin124]|nr:MAG: putative N-acetyltransferase [Methanomassiliicoccales archaeon PtaU1.Bin124]